MILIVVLLIKICWGHTPDFHVQDCSKCDWNTDLTMNMVGGVTYVNSAQKYYAINPGSYHATGTVSDYLETAAALTVPVKISAWIRSTGSNDPMQTSIFNPGYDVHDGYTLETGYNTNDAQYWSKGTSIEAMYDNHVPTGWHRVQIEIGRALGALVSGTTVTGSANSGTIINECELDCGNDSDCAGDLVCDLRNSILDLIGCTYAPGAITNSGWDPCYDKKKSVEYSWYDS